MKLTMGKQYYERGLIKVRDESQRVQRKEKREGNTEGLGRGDRILYPLRRRGEERNKELSVEFH